MVGGGNIDLELSAQGLVCDREQQDEGNSVSQSGVAVPVRAG